ncbi:MAG TPA: LptF/LptG family permease, partial [Cellvibrionaceae bacterium]
MVKLDRYIMRTVAAAVLAVLLVVLALDFIGKLVEQLDDISAEYSFYELLIYLSWGVPRGIYDYLPYAVLVGCLIGLGVLASSSELVIIRAAGVSVARIVWMVLKPVLVFIALGLVLGEYVIPYADQVSESRRALALGHTQSAQAQRGVWHREADEFIHFNVILPDGQVYGVTRYRFDESGQLNQVSFAEQAMFSDNRWQERGISITHFNESGLTSERV